MKNSKKQKKLKSKILLLFITIIMFGTSTYAWFTANQTVTISSLDVHVEASNGLQISTDGVTWKTVITNEDITSHSYTNNRNQVPSLLNAVSTAGAVDLVASSDNYGYMKMYKGNISSDQTTGNYTITSTASPEAQGTAGDYIAFDIFLKVDKDETIYLTKNSNVNHKDTLGQDNSVINDEDKGLKNTARVAFVLKGHADADDPIGTITGASDLLGSANSVKIWEPNADIHTSSALTIASEYGIKNASNSTLTNGDMISYYGLNNTFGVQDLKDTVKGAQNTNTSLISNTIKTTGAPTEQNPRTNLQIMSLEDGITKVRVYMWIEGQDIDCENNASGTDISYNVILSTLAS